MDHGSTGKGRAAAAACPIRPLSSVPPGAAALADWTLRPDGRPLRNKIIATDSPTNGAAGASITPATPTGDRDGAAALARRATSKRPAAQPRRSPFDGAGSKSFRAVYADGKRVDRRTGRYPGQLIQPYTSPDGSRIGLHGVKGGAAEWDNTDAGVAALVKYVRGRRMYSDNDTQATPDAALGTLLSPEYCRKHGLTWHVGRGSGGSGGSGGI